MLSMVYDVSIIDIWKQLALFVNIMQLHCDKYILQSIGLYIYTNRTAAAVTLKYLAHDFEH